ncbi:MAG: hypothetical protein AAGE59_13535 [Cyanobacteria bacterium P01_F01_bin.86]
MTFVIEPSQQQKPLSFDEFWVRYGSDNRYELIDGEVFDLEPTGKHEEVAGKPKQPTLSICTLVDGEYDIKLLRGKDAIASATFPNLNLTAEQILQVNR